MLPKGKISGFWVGSQELLHVLFVGYKSKDPLALFWCTFSSHTFVYNVTNVCNICFRSMGGKLTFKYYLMHKKLHLCFVPCSGYRKISPTYITCVVYIYVWLSPQYIFYHACKVFKMHFENAETSEKNCENYSRAGDNIAPQGILKACQEEDSDITGLQYLRTSRASFSRWERTA